MDIPENPQIVPEQQEQQSKNGVKNQKKKEKKKLQKQTNQQIIQQVEQELKDTMKVSEEDSFQVELTWCLKQLHLGLINDGLTPEQASESREVISLLESEKVPAIKKRLTMKSIFGDYRKLMKVYK